MAKCAGVKPKRGTMSSDSRKTEDGTPARKYRGGRPTKRESEELGRRILDIAAGLFATQGFAATSMEQVAAECGAGKDTVYRRYSSKVALFTAIMERFRTEVIQDLDETMREDGPPLERLRRYARSLLSINLRPELLSLNRVALGEAIALGGVKPTPTDEDPLMIRFAALVTDAQRAGDLGSGDPLFIAEQLLYATSIKPMIAAMLGKQQFADTAEQQRYFDHAWSLFMDGAACPGTRSLSTSRAS